MPSRHTLVAFRSLAAAFCLFVSLCCLCSVDAQAQQRGRQQPRGRQTQRLPPSTVIAPERRAPAPLAGETDKFCAGFIELDPAPFRFQIIGGEQEQEQRIYADGDFVFIDGGAQQGVTAGQEFSVIRPRGRFKSEWTDKKGTLGVYTQELGRLRVSEVKADMSVAVVVRACETILHGDVLRAVPQPPALLAPPDDPIARFNDASGKQLGRIVLARDGREMLSRNHVVYIDLGREDNIKPGDVFTIFRPSGTGNIVRTDKERQEITPNTTGGIGSDRFEGGDFSNQAQRAVKPNGTGFKDQRPITTPEVMKRRPSVPRKVVGELIVLNVEARTATAIITRVAQEVFTSDYVELQ